MHFCLYVITKEFPSDEILEKVLEPYDANKLWEGLEEDEKPENVPVFTWDWWQVGGRYSGKLKLKADESSNDKYRWMFYEKYPRAGRLFRSKLLEEIHDKRVFICPEEECFYSMGIRDGYIYVDGALISDLMNWDKECDNCFCLIDADGSAYARKTWLEEECVEDKQFDEKVRSISDQRKDCYVCVVDLHD